MSIELLITGSVDLEVRIFFKNNVEKLNDEQENIQATLKMLIDRDEGRLFKVDTPGGTGKKFVI